LFLQLRFGDEKFTQPNLLLRQRGFFDALEEQEGISGDCHTVHYDDLATGGGTVRELLSILEEKSSDAIVYCADIPYRFLLKQPELSKLPTVVIGGKPEELEELSGNIPEVISFNMEYVGCLAAMRLHERIMNPRLGVNRKFIPAGNVFGLDSETDVQSP
jgi:DNA-binding LacI/PurR family transcriptional regulator